MGVVALPPRTPTAMRPGQCQMRAATTPSTAYTSSSARLSLGGNGFDPAVVATMPQGLTHGSLRLKERPCVCARLGQP